MSYIKAEEILPKDLLESIQEYVDGRNIYIPRKNRGAVQPLRTTPYREELQQRNVRIRADRKAGYTISELAAKYFLSEKSIGRILRDKNQ